ncbi:MAG TPA: type II toxin-antitoxin system RelE/ParE family toxin [Planctomycetaceae bacterium]|nr:type II toxin-antitoxin system RelE/ParE family toxin [Planctomycetaceae bacterium]
MPRFRVSKAARRDLGEIASYIARDNPPAALRLRAAFADRFGMLSRQPLIGEACETLGSRLRMFPHGSYVIYYVPAPGGVRIARVIHGARDQQDVLDVPE